MLLLELYTYEYDDVVVAAPGESIWYVIGIPLCVWSSPATTLSRLIWGKPLDGGFGDMSTSCSGPGAPLPESPLELLPSVRFTCLGDAWGEAHMFALEECNASSSADVLLHSLVCSLHSSCRANSTKWKHHKNKPSCKINKRLRTPRMKGIGKGMI
jgi:hypothetical protein